MSVDASTSSASSTAARFNANTPSVKRILREIRELRAEATALEAFIAEPCEDDIFEFHFAVFGPPRTAFERGIYHGRILLPPEYPFKPPSFVLLTANGRFETGTKICLSISQHHPKQWQPSWSIRAALTAMRAFFPTPPEGAVGSLDWSDDVRRELAAASWRASEPTFAHGNEKRRALSASVHERMLARMEAVMAMESVKDAGDDGASASEGGARSENAIEDDDANEDDVEDEATSEGGLRSRASEDDVSTVEGADGNDVGVEPSRAMRAEDVAREDEREAEREDENDEDPPRPVTPPNETEREDRLARRAQELAKTKQQLDTTAWALVFAIVAITIKRLVVQQVIGALQ